MYGVHFEALQEGIVLGRRLAYEAKSGDRDDTYRLIWGEEEVWKGYSDLPEMRQAVRLAVEEQVPPLNALRRLMSGADFNLWKVAEGGYRY